MSDETDYRCDICGKSFGCANAVKQHRRDKHEVDNYSMKRQLRASKHKPPNVKLAHRPDVGIEGARAVLDDIGADMSDGTYYALAEDLGLSIDDLVDTDE